MDEINKILEYLQAKDAEKRERRKQPYSKPDSLRQLERLHLERKNAKRPGFAHIKTTFRDDSANALTRSITAWLQLHGHFAARVNTTGTYNQKLKKYIHSGSRRGMADITAVINGRHVSIEIKHGKDRILPEQLKVKSEIEQAGGIYIIASTFDNFLQQIKNL